ncbi:hypothetical protein [Micromonospora sp. NPDC004704]
MLIFASPTKPRTAVQWHRIRIHDASGQPVTTTYFQAAKNFVVTSAQTLINEHCGAYGHVTTADGEYDLVGA